MCKDGMSLMALGIFVEGVELSAFQIFLLLIFCKLIVAEIYVQFYTLTKFQ